MNSDYPKKYFVISGIAGIVFLVWWLKRSSSDSPRKINYTETSGDMSGTEKKRELGHTTMSEFEHWNPFLLKTLSHAVHQNVRDPYAYVHESRWVTVVVDSRDRDLERHPHPNAYDVRLTEPLRHVVRARLISAEIPSTFYVFSKTLGNTTLYIKVSGVQAEVQIPDGNYGIENMVKALDYSLSQVFPTLRLEVIADPITHRIGLQSLDQPPIPFSIHTGDYIDGKNHWGLGYYLGFPRNANIYSQDGRLEGTRPVILNPETYMMLDIAEFGSVQEMGIHGNARLSGTKPFAKIPIQVRTFEYTFIDKPFGINEMHPPIQEVGKLSIRWRFHDGTPVDFEDVDHSFTLEVLCTHGRNV